MQKFLKYGPNWEEVRCYLPGRSYEQIKSKFHQIKIKALIWRRNPTELGISSSYYKAILNGTLNTHGGLRFKPAVAIESTVAQIMRIFDEKND